jgi:tetratricopeptide (TPR) repeat protein
MRFAKILVLLPFLTWEASAQITVAPNFDQMNYPQFSINLSLIGSNVTNADSYFDEAERYERVGDYNEAAKLFGKAAQQYQAAKKHARYGTALIRQSNAHLLQNNFTDAEQILLKSALKSFSRTGNRPGQMAAYQQLAKTYAASNRLTQAMWFYTQQGILAQQLKDKSAYIESILGIASVKIKKREYKLAIQDLNSAELLCKNAKIVQYAQQIKSNRLLISQSLAAKKG